MYVKVSVNVPLILFTKHCCLLNTMMYVLHLDGITYASVGSRLLFDNYFHFTERLFIVITCCFL